MEMFIRMEKVVITITGVLCAALVLKLLYSLRTILPWRVNCWFCNYNCWVKFFERNCWTCPSCDQYNGFTKDGNYNKPLFSPTEPPRRTPKMFTSRSPSNGLCKMCNINQQLKVAQLANFVPMNEKNFDEEIESYRAQLEKAYKLCTPCKKVLQMKLHKEKEVLLGTKLLQSRTPEKKSQKLEIRNERVWNIIHNTSLYLAVVIFVLVSVECYSNVIKDESMLATIRYTKDILYGLLERILLIIKMKLLMTFPMLEEYLIDLQSVIYLDKWQNHTNFDFNDNLGFYNILTQEALLGLAVILQTIGYISCKDNVKTTFVADFLWAMFGIICIINHSLGIYPNIISFGKLITILGLMIVHKKMKTKPRKASKFLISPKSINFTKSNSTSSLNDEGDVSIETDDDVSLSQYGLHNLSESSNETSNTLNNSSMNGRSFTPRSDKTVWSKPKMNSTINSTFRVNTALKSPSSVSEIVFAKPSYNNNKTTKDKSFTTYQKLSNDSDSELDESISSLYIGSPKKTKQNGSIFSLRKFTATPNFVVPTPLSRRPLISPSKLGLGASWVAGGYWGAEAERAFNDGSRSSSQSSGFESQASSVPRRAVASQPPSREESLCGENLTDRFPNPNLVNFNRGFRGNIQAPQNFSGSFNSPVFPQMQYNSHVHIPQPRFAQCVPSVFSSERFKPNGFAPPGRSGLIRLPQTTSFASS